MLGRQLYATLSLVGQFVVPLTVIAVLYYRIFQRLRARAAAAAASSSSSQHVTSSSLITPLNLANISSI